MNFCNPLTYGMRIIIISTIIFHISQIGHAQQESKFDYFIGYGFYEGYNIGGEYYFKSKKQSVSLSVGYDKLLKQEYKSLILSYNLAIFKDRKNSSEEFKWYLDNKAVLWQLEDNYYLWRAISIIPSLSRKIILYKKLRMSFDIGPSFNIVLYNKRKTFEEVGWPYHVMPDFRILFIY